MTDYTEMERGWRKYLKFDGQWYALYAYNAKTRAEMVRAGESYKQAYGTKYRVVKRKIDGKTWYALYGRRSGSMLSGR